jgi:hypothetical protein
MDALKGMARCILVSRSDRTAILKGLDERTASTTCNLSDGGTVFSRCFSTRGCSEKRGPNDWESRFVSHSRAHGLELELFFCQRAKLSGRFNRSLVHLTARTSPFCGPAKDNRGVATSHLLSCLRDPEEEAPPNETVPEKARPDPRSLRRPLFAKFAADHRSPERLGDGDAVRSRNNCGMKTPLTAQRADTDSGLPGARELGGFRTNVSASKFLRKGLLPFRLHPVSPRIAASQIYPNDDLLC